MGSTLISHRPATEQETTPRIFIQVNFEGIETIAFVDTGAPFVICQPEIAAALDVNPQNGERIENFNIRGHSLNGSLQRMTVTIVADEGADLPVDATVFIPDLYPYQEAFLPSILGLNTFLERIRFAVDPDEERFYFGGIGQDEL